MKYLMLFYFDRQRVKKLSFKKYLILFLMIFKYLAAFEDI